jgi:hypothetical protein
LRHDHEALAECVMGAVRFGRDRFIRAISLTKEIFTLIAGLVLAFISATTIGFSKVFSHPANLFAIFFLIILALVSFAEDKEADAKRISTWLKRRDGPMLYTRAVQGLMRALDRLLMPATAADQPMPTRGWYARLDWLTTPRARDTGDLQRLRRNPWSWPVYDAALGWPSFTRFSWPWRNGRGLARRQVWGPWSCFLKNHGTGSALCFFVQLRWRSFSGLSRQPHRSVSMKVPRCGWQLLQSQSQSQA